MQVYKKSKISKHISLFLERAMPELLIKQQSVLQFQIFVLPASFLKTGLSLLDFLLLFLESLEESSDGFLEHLILLIQVHLLGGGLLADHGAFLLLLVQEDLGHHFEVVVELLQQVLNFILVLEGEPAPEQL